MLLALLVWKRNYCSNFELGNKPLEDIPRSSLPVLVTTVASSSSVYSEAALDVGGFLMKEDRVRVKQLHVGYSHLGM
jgi:hypothetical protein